MSAKASLKAAKAALDAEDYSKAIVEAQTVLESDPSNYFARLFLGRGLEKQGKFDDAAKAYHAAAKLKPDDSQAWLGLCSVYEAQNGGKINEYLDAAVKAADIFAKVDDKYRCQTVIDKLTSSVKQHGTPAQYKRSLEVLLPGTQIYDCLEGRIPPPAQTYARLAELTEIEEAERIKREIAERRTRIGARLGQVTTEVKREVLGSSSLEQLYQQIINWSSDDDVRREYEEKLLKRVHDHLVVTQAEAKGERLNRVLDLAEGMVIIKHPFQKAWDLVLETRDIDDLRDLDVNVLREYVAFFPDSGLAKILQAWLSSELSPFPAPPRVDGEDDERVAEKPLSPEERLLHMTEGLSSCESSPLAHRLVGDHYLQLEEHETAAETAKAGLIVTATEGQKLGMSLQNTKDALNSVLGTALVHHQAPRNHPQARRLFDDILQRKPRSTPALIGLGLILEETEDYDDAIRYFSQALEQNSSNVIVGTELAWCRALAGDYSQALQELKAWLPQLKADDPHHRDTRAQVLYRIGVCLWNLDTSKSARKDRNGAYASFLAAIKTNVNFAPAYTSLGYYYLEYAKDKKRARQCFQKAFELSPAETDAAEQLARSFADQGDWDIVEVIAQRVVDSGRARPPPGSKRKGISWPYSALGFVQMNKQEYSSATVNFLAALRISPDDYQSYVGLGESYHNSGRYNSALRTLSFALGPPEGVNMKSTVDTWFARYMLANVHRELGDHDEAIEGLQAVLKERPSEFGVQISLLQTFVEKGWKCLERGMYGQAVASAVSAINTALEAVEARPQAFNLWKAVGDACLLFSWVQSASESFPSSEVRTMLESAVSQAAYSDLTDVDNVSLDSSGDAEVAPALSLGIVAFKRAIATSAHDVHAQAVSWYNLGWAEHRAFACAGSKAGRRYLKAAVHCFKRAIELEAGNAEFWNALGVVTSGLNPKVAQHAFVRSLHLNELNAKVWTNLGVLYLLQGDNKLAHAAFGRAQSTDPDYAHAWVGEGLIALLLGDTYEALSHFTHAFEISDASSITTRRQYALSSFDHLISSQSGESDLVKLIRPLFALEQLQAQSPNELPPQHLAALLLERAGKHTTAVDAFSATCAAAEAEYEKSESLAALARFAHATSDLARCRLATGALEDAAESAATALDLTLEADNSGLDAETRRKLRLSSHLTAGLAMHHLGKGSEAISMFRSALQESNSNPDAVCLLVKVLWSHGGPNEKNVARDQLFETAEKHPEHVASVTLLGAMAALDDDRDTTAAVQQDLQSLRLNDKLRLMQQQDIDGLLAALAGLCGADESYGEAQSAVLLKPDQPQVWTELAVISGDSYAAVMALEAAQKTTPPSGEIAVERLATAHADLGTARDSQTAVVLAPWEQTGWTSLHAATIAGS